MLNKNKTIFFQASTEKAELLTDHPTPGYLHIPSWFKKQKLFSNNENSYMKAIKKSDFVKTFKLCTPLVDSISSGYMMTLPADIVVTNTSNDGGYLPNITWSVSWVIVDAQDVGVMGGYPIPTGYYPQMFRWHPDWIIKTPAGYSLWVTHPSHRHDLPFLTLNSFVDTDSHPNEIMFPFFIKYGFEGIIEKGTPIVQVIPVKRDSWKTNLKKFDIKRSIIGFDNVNLKLSRVYKNSYWFKKRYD
jgi:hypothetical protein